MSIVTVIESEMKVDASKEVKHQIDDFLFHHIMQYFSCDDEDIERRNIRYRITIEEID